MHTLEMNEKDYLSATITYNEYKGIMLHELGHAICAWSHEHQLPSRNWNFDPQKVYNRYSSYDKQTVDDNVLAVESKHDLSPYDPDSIMHYEIDQTLINWDAGLSAASQSFYSERFNQSRTQLSIGDKEQLEALYPLRDVVSCVPRIEQYDAQLWTEDILWSLCEDQLTTYVGLWMVIQESMDYLGQFTPYKFRYVSTFDGNAETHIVIAITDAYTQPVFGQQVKKVRDTPNMYINVRSNASSIVHHLAHVLGLRDVIDCGAPSIFDFQRVCSAAPVQSEDGSIENTLMAMYNVQNVVAVDTTGTMQVDEEGDSTSVEVEVDGVVDRNQNVLIVAGVFVALVIVLAVVFAYFKSKRKG